MKKIMITNNPKVQDFELYMEVEYMENKTVFAILNEGKKLAEQGGQLLIDPSKVSPIKSYYKSLPFFFTNNNAPDERSLALINAALAQLEKVGSTEEFRKEPLLSWLLQGKDYDIIDKIVS